MELSITNNTREHRFETVVDGEAAFVEYRIAPLRDAPGGRPIMAIYLMHTFVPPALEGRGIAGAIAKWSLDWVRAESLPLKVYCPYIKAYMERHPEWNDLLVDV